MPCTVTDEVRYRILTYLSEHPDATQRELAQALGVSLGKANYCLRALVRKGLVKIRNFRSSRRKSAYVYILTTRGLEEKISVAYAFLRRKVEEYDLLREEIERLRVEVQELGATQE